MRAECFPVAQIPHVSRIYSNYLTTFQNVSRYYSRAPFARDWFAEEAKCIDYPDDRRNSVADVLESQNKTWGAGPETLKNIARLRAGAAAVVTGQQVSLFGGPLFSILKALTAVKIAEEATATGVNAVPIFWLATEDHDFAEVSSAKLPGPHGLQKLQVAALAKEGAPVSAVHFGSEIEEITKTAANLLGDSEVSDLLQKTYLPGASFGDAFARLFTRIFAEHGVILLDAADSRLHQLAKPVYVRAAEESSEITQALLNRNRELESNGFHAQVKVTNSSTLLFAIQDGIRTPVQRVNSHFAIGKARFTAEEFRSRVTERAQDFSANVLLRPSVQDFLLPTLAYIGGPAEVAYFAQAAVVYEKILRRITPVLPRISATIVEPQIGRRLSGYELGLKDVFLSEEQLARLLAKRSLSEELSTRFSSAKNSLEEMLHSLAGSLEKLDPTLKQAAAKSGSKMRYQLSRIESRAALAEQRRNRELEHHAHQLINALYPHKNLQEREIAGVYFLARYGTQMLHEMKDTLQSNCPEHQVLYL
jgi:bacillithiol synthase